MNDPLNALPPEIVLQIIDLLPSSTTARLTRLSKAWHSFIDTSHQDRIYSHPSKVDRPPATNSTAINTRDFSFLAHQNNFTHYYHGVSNWKDLCKRQALLQRNFTTSSTPVTRESIYQVNLLQVWRFRPDFKRRFIITTSELGGVHVTDMDTGEELWCDNSVREFAHLEYDMETGTAAWDAFGDIVEVWRIEEGHRARFKLLEVLEHDCQTRGFQIRHGDLSVVSSEGQAFVYDIIPTVKLKKKLQIAEGAVGHLCQNREVVMFSMGERGYHIHSKETGNLVGVIDPSKCSNINHIKHDRASFNVQQHYPRITGPAVPPFPPQTPRIDRLAANVLEPGPHPDRQARSLEEDDWGAGLLDGDTMAGVSRRGRLFICTNWRQVLSSAGQYDTTSSIIECETNPVSFDLGGWLSLRHGKVSIEVNDCIYLMNTTAEDKAPIWAMRTGSSPISRAPVSFMAIWDDCFMYTYVTHCALPLNTNIMTPAKTIRVLSFDPELE